MNVSEIMTIGQHALWVTIELSAPLLLSGLAIGLVISILQAATQVNEMTLAFIPKILVMGLALIVGGSWMLHLLIDFTINLIHSIPAVING